MSETLVGMFLDTIERHRKPAQFLRKHENRWEEMSAERARADVERLALGLAALGVVRGDRVALLSESRYEWPITDLAIMAMGAITVPIYPTLTAEQCRAMLEDSGARAVVISTAAQLEKLHPVIEQLPEVVAVIVMSPTPAQRPREHTMESVLRRGAEARRADPAAFGAMVARVAPEDVATIIYTSGTTGEPKGAMLSHSNIASNVRSCLSVVDLGPTDVSLSFLPLCHIFERMAGLYAMLAAGVTIAYAESFDTVAANAAEVRPTVITGVPRFYEKVYARVMENALAQPGLRRTIFFWGLHQGLAAARLRFERRRVPAWRAVTAAIADRLVGHKVRARVGGRIRMFISGGAPLAPKVMEFFFAIGMRVLEGYGLTETSPVICLNRPGREKPGTVGPPIPGVEVRFGDEGEILTRGPHVMKGYYRNEEATRLALRDGWFHTGDIGRFDEDGSLVITDRLKELLVTAGGKKVAPQPLEGRLKTSKWISEVVLVGDRRPYVVCLIVPNFATLDAEARHRQWKAATPAELLERPEVRAVYQAEIDRLNRDLAPFEQIKRFALLDRELSQEGGELTPTLKVKRRVIDRKFSDLIASLYDRSTSPAST